jgi:predicted nucleotidyltransferase
MTRDQVLQVLREHKPELAAQYGVTRLALFGSVAQDRATETSDVDIVLEMRRPDLFYLVHIKALLEEVLGCPVDVVRYGSRMGAFLKRRIDEEAVDV